jgi:hypothetical protein
VSPIHTQTIGYKVSDQPTTHIPNYWRIKTNRTEHNKKHPTKNGYSTNLTTKPIPHKQNTQENPNRQETKWVIFTFCGKEVGQITKLLKNTQLRIAFRAKKQKQNTISNILNKHTGIDKYDNSGTYEMLGLPIEIYWPNWKDV